MKLYNLSCPSCGGTLTGLGRSRVVSCRYCGAPHLVVAERFVPRYAIPAVPKRRAVESLKEMLRHPELPTNFTVSVSMRQSTLYYVPFWEFHGRRLGLRRVNQSNETRDGRPGRAEDTEVHLGDFSRFVLSTQLDHWGMEHASLPRDGRIPHSRLHEFDENELSKDAMVLSPDASAEAMEARFSIPEYMSPLTLDNQVEIVEARLSLFYYPVWVFRYEYMGRIYGVYVDGADGTVLRGRAPRRENRRVAALLWLVAALAFPVSQMIRLLVAAFRDGDEAAAVLLVPLAYLLVLGAPVGLAVLAVAWNTVRFSQEFTFFPGGPSVRHVGKPAETWAERLFERYCDGFEKWYQGREEEGTHRHPAVAVLRWLVVRVWTFSHRRNP